MEQILKDLKERAKLSFNEDHRGSVHGLPPAIYTSEDIYALEQENIFAKGWQCAGRVDDIPNVGDYLTFSIGKQKLFVVRSSLDKLRCFSNICRHRMMQLLEGRGQIGVGKVKQIVCPYHAWTYGLDGQLIRAPKMKQAQREGQVVECREFSNDEFNLPEVRLEIFQGWIYVNLDHQADTVASQLSELADITERYQMTNYISVVNEDHVWKTNWKLLCENFMEGYHLPIAHKKTVGSWFPTDKTVFPEKSHEYFTYQYFEKSAGAKYGIAHADNNHLKGEWRQRSIMPTVFPCHMYVLAPDHLWYLSLRPLSVGETQVRFGVSLAPEVYHNLENKAESIADLAQFFDHVNDEDRRVVESIYQGALAPLSTAGPLCWLERELHDFMKYLSNQLT